MVSTGLGLDGGGVAAVSRLLATAARDWGRLRNVKFELFSLEETSKPPPELGFARTFHGKPSLALGVLNWELRHRYGVVLFDHLGPARLQAFLPTWRRCPYLVFLHGIEIWHPLRRSARRALENATILLSNSDFTQRKGAAFAPATANAEVLPLALEEDGVPAAQASEFDAPLLDRAGEEYVLIVGRMSSSERYKGHDELLEAVAELKRHGRDARLVVTGEGDDRARLEKRASDLGVTNSVLFTGFVSEATRTELYRHCAVFALPSRNEGFGLVYLEAMKAGKPVIALRGSAAEEIVVDGQTGLLVEPGSVHALANALDTLLIDPSLAANMGKSGHARWESEFTLEKFRERIFTQLDRLSGWTDKAREIDVRN